jgi:hypothetical protein
VSDWMTIRVVLAGQGEQELAQPPGRLLLVHADHSFSDLGEAIDVALARWDLTPLHQFEVEGRVLVSPDAGDADPEAEQSDEVTVGEVGLRAGARFTYVFDLGEAWTHECTVEDVGMDPFEVAGEEPELPLPVFGWGTIPDQYGRVTEDDEDAPDGPALDLDDDDEEDVDEGWEDAAEDEEQDWEDAESASWAVVSRALAGEQAQPDEEALRAAVAALRGEGDGWEHEVLWAAAELDPGSADPDDEETWVALAAAVVQPSPDVPVDAEAAAAWAALEPADWAGAVIELVRSGPGTSAEPDALLELIARCPEVEGEDLTEEDEAVILDGLDLVVALWGALGAVDDERRLTPLGRWGLPRALERAWTGEA